MCKARPRSEGDQAAVRGRVAGSKKQKHTERDIKAHHHRQSRVLLRHQHKRINGSAKEQSNQYKHNLKRTFSLHRRLLAVTNLWAMPSKSRSTSGVTRD